jgi:phage-related tail protein
MGDGDYAEGKDALLVLESLARIEAALKEGRKVMAKIADNVKATLDGVAEVKAAVAEVKAELDGLVASGVKVDLTPALDAVGALDTKVSNLAGVADETKAAVIADAAVDSSILEGVTETPPPSP